MVRWASIDSRVWWKIGRARQVALAHPERRLDVPQVVVAGDDLTGGHHRGGDVRDVALQPGQAPRPGEGRLVQGLGAVLGGDEPRCAGGLLAGDDGLGPVLLQGEGLAVPGGPFAGVGPHRPPGPVVHGRVPHRLGLLVHVVDAAGGGGRHAWGDGVDELPVGERVPVPAEVRRQVGRRLRHPGADDEPQPGLVAAPSGSSRTASRRPRPRPCPTASAVPGTAG